MPYARVGAMPQPSHHEDHNNDHQHGRGRGGRQSGITMQDLKKQTAMRLAQEQHQRRSATRHPQQSHHGKYQSHQPQMQPSMPYQGHHSNHSPNPNQYYDYYQQQPYNYQPNFRYQNSTSTNEEHSKRLPLQQSSYQLQQRQGKSPVQKVTTHTPQRHQRVSPQPRQPAQTNQSQKWQLDMLSETSSVRSYEYDCNASSTSNIEGTEAASTVSGGSGSRYAQQPMLGSVSSINTAVAAGDVPVSPLPQSLPSSCDPMNQRQTRSQIDSSSVMSAASSKASSKGGVSNSSSATVPASTSSRSQQHTQHGKAKNRKQQKSSLPQTSSNQQQPPQVCSPHSYQKQQHRRDQDASSVSSSFSRDQNPRNSNNKLPHGLTVHELKEMTRARLAAEAAAEKQEQHVMLVMRQQQQQGDAGSVQSPKASGGIPSNSSAVTDNPVRALLHAGGDSHYHQSSSTSLDSSASQQTQVLRQSPHSWQRVQQHQQNYSASSQSSLQQHQQSAHYLSPIKQSHHQSNFQQSQSNQQSFQDQQRQLFLDSLETTSVASFNSTLGSESAQSTSFLGAGLQPPSSNDDLMSFGRSWSYPAGASLGSSVEQTDTPKSSSSFFETSGLVGSIGGGRRRLGSSPPGFHLEVPHEDRPLTVTDELSLPVFDTPNPHRWGPINGHDEVSAVSADSSPSYSDRYQRIASCSGFNRQVIIDEQHDSLDRAPSPSSEICKHGSQELNDSHELVLPPLSFGEACRGISSGGMSMSGDLPNWVAESVLVTPLLHDGNKTNFAAGQHVRERSLTDGGAIIMFDSLSADSVNKSDSVFRSGNNTVGAAIDREIRLTSSGGFLTPDAATIGKNKPEESSSVSWSGCGIADLMGLPGHFGSFLSQSQSSSQPKNSNDGDGAEDDISSANLISRIDPEVFEPAPINKSLLTSSETKVITPKDSGDDLLPRDQIHPASARSKGKEFTRSTGGETSSPSPTVSSSSTSSFRPHQSRTSNKKKRDKNRKKRENDFRSSN